MLGPTPGPGQVVFVRITTVHALTLQPLLLARPYPNDTLTGRDEVIEPGTVVIAPGRRFVVTGRQPNSPRPGITTIDLNEITPLTDTSDPTNTDPDRPGPRPARPHAPHTNPTGGVDAGPGLLVKEGQVSQDGVPVLTPTRDADRTGHITTTHAATSHSTSGTASATEGTHPTPDPVIPTTPTGTALTDAELAGAKDIPAGVYFPSGDENDNSELTAIQFPYLPGVRVVIAHRDPVVFDVVRVNGVWWSATEFAPKVAQALGQGSEPVLLIDCGGAVTDGQAGAIAEQIRAHTGRGVLANEGIVWQLSSNEDGQRGLEGIVTTPLELDEDTFQPKLVPPTQRTHLTGPPWYYYPPGIEGRVERSSSLAKTLTTQLGVDSTPLFTMHTTHPTAWILHHHP
jgi:hypothetical protein